MFSAEALLSSAAAKNEKTTMRKKAIPAQAMVEVII